MPSLLTAAKLTISGLVEQSLPNWIRRPSYPELPEAVARRRVEEHLECTAMWLLRSVQANSDGGSSKGFHLLRGWMPSYPETTGYLIPTLFDYSCWADRPEFGELALRLGEWLTSIQHPDGSFRGGDMKEPPVPAVFNTGQIVFGLLRCYAEANQSRFLDAAERASDFLVSVADQDGAWRRFDFCGIPHVYSCRSAWALLLAHKATGNAKYRQAALANYEWALSQQRANGWYDNNSFRPGQLPNTHGIAYVTQSMVEAYALTSDRRFLESAIRAAFPLLEQLERNGMIFGQHDQRWRSPVRYVCVTGTIQLAITWLRLHQICDDVRYLNAALKIIDSVMRIQSPADRNPGIRGGVPGSSPIYGRYAPMQYPNWAAKFWVDCLLLAETIARQLTDRLGESRETQADAARHNVVLRERYSG